jgi:hypothetical protein
MKTLCVVCAVAVLGIGQTRAFAQAFPPAAPAQFEAASVKPSDFR